MSEHVVFVGLPGLRPVDLIQMPTLKEVAQRGAQARLLPSFPAVTCPVQAAMTTGKLVRDHGVVSNGFYYRDRGELEMWTAWNECIQHPQIFEALGKLGKSTAAWFPLHSKGVSADYVCEPAPIHNPDGTESMWCYTKPTELYQELLDEMGHFPLHHFWGPMAGIQGSEWIARSAAKVVDKYRPNFMHVYLPHLDYAAQKHGPDSDEAMKACGELDRVLASFVESILQTCGEQVSWIFAGEYAISSVDHVCYPNRILREAGLLTLDRIEGKEHLNLAASKAWALVDHQFSHCFVGDGTTPERVAALFQGAEGIAEVLVGDERKKYELDHPLSGDVILISQPSSWQSYYWWEDDELAPPFARTVDIHNKPGYDPVELFFDPKTKSIPLNANLVRGSHGAPVVLPEQESLLVVSDSQLVSSETVRDVEIPAIVERAF